MEQASGILIASSIHTLISGAQRKEESEWNVILDSPLFRYILIFALSYAITKKIEQSFVILFFWVLIKTTLKLIIKKTTHLSSSITPNIPVHDTEKIDNLNQCKSMLLHSISQ